MAISFNTDANNITYQLFADSITEPMAAHIHISPSVGANGSVSIPLFQAPFVNLPGTTTTGLLAGNALMPTAFVGPYLEVLPNYDNVPVSQVLSQYVQTGLAYAQVLSCSRYSVLYLLGACTCMVSIQARWSLWCVCAGSYNAVPLWSFEGYL